MSEVEEETNTCSYEECSGGGRENLSWRCLNGKWVNDYRAFMRKVHLLTPTAFLSRWDWDCLRRDWDKFRCRRRKFCDPFRGSCLCRGDADRPWRKLRQNMTLPKSRTSASHVFRRLNLHCHWWVILSNHKLLKKTMGRNNKVCIIRLFHSCSFIYRMVKQKGGRRLPLADDRTDLIEKVDMVNERFFSYYRAQSIIPEEEWQSFLETIRSHLPTTFRVAGSRQCVRIVGWWWQSLMQTERPIPSILPFATYTYPHWVM